MGIPLRIKKREKGLTEKKTYSNKYLRILIIINYTQFHSAYERAAVVARSPYGKMIFKSREHSEKNREANHCEQQKKERRWRKKKNV